MTEAFRRDRRMHSFAIHLFIDAFPASWMKAIMDYDRQPKPAWFAYREALTPLAVSLRTDRRAFFAGEPIEPEAWVCNDLHDAPPGAKLHYQLECDGQVLQAGSTAATIPALDAAYQGTLPLRAPEVPSRTQVTIRLGLLDAGGKVLHDTAIKVDVFPRTTAALRRIYVVGNPQGKAAQLAGDLGTKPVFEGPMQAGDAILIDDMQAFSKVETQVGEAVRAVARAVFLQLPQGKYPIAGGDVAVGSGDKSDVMMGVTAAGLHFVSRATGHRARGRLSARGFQVLVRCQARSSRASAAVAGLQGFRLGTDSPELQRHGGRLESRRPGPLVHLSNRVGRPNRGQRGSHHLRPAAAGGAIADRPIGSTAALEPQPT